MLLERKQEILKLLKDNYAIIRDEDWEVLCLLWRNDEGYFVYSWEEYKFTKSDAEALLDKAAWVALLPVVDNKITKQYKDQLDEHWKKVNTQIEDDYFEEE